MANKIIKHRLFTWFEEVDSPVVPGQKVLSERINHLGDDVNITNPAYVKRGEDLGSFYTDDEAEKIRKGTYDGADADILYRARGEAVQAPLALDQGGQDVSQLDAADLGEYIKANRLTVPQTLALVSDNANEEEIQRVLDAENIATNNSPRAGVTDVLEKRLAAD